MINEMFDANHVVFNSDIETKDDALRFIASFAEHIGIVKSSKSYYKGLKKREKEVTTGFKDGIAIPHCKHKTVLKPALMLVKFTQPIEWESMDKKAVHITFALAIPEGENQEHLKALSTISRALIDETFIDSLLSVTSEAGMYKLIRRKFSN
ncbi:MAG: PTS sugar transporter subunit IIA [Bacillota bacterium]|uniref:PTS sugar transporter subunit IIA n=1 Tax=unclassified Virgibacillus TaxID=2620237 RepID=UPI000EF4D9FF|nr:MULTISPECIES: PTS sugar transporter subunit IIA [unclassified Virgibacillus]MCC2249509.1 PTS sugar transporter subunit IIA [Virgibacillus sp. AGTR]QRZ17873.1 PTS sugar transporter subunit IIA [Virgibacillus sp. AGTR]